MIRIAARDTLDPFVEAAAPTRAETGLNSIARARAPSKLA